MPLRRAGDILIMHDSCICLLRFMHPYELIMLAVDASTVKVHETTKRNVMMRFQGITRVGIMLAGAMLVGLVMQERAAHPVLPVRQERQV